MFKKIGTALSKLTDWSAQHGHLVFALYFAAYGSFLQWYHKLDVNFIMLIGAIQAFLLGHQINDKFFSNKNGSSDSDQKDGSQQD